MLSVLHRASAEYDAKLTCGSTPDQTMFGLAWDVQELEAINSEGRSIRIEISAVMGLCMCNADIHSNVPRKLEDLRKRWCSFLKRVMRFKRIPATHVFVFMLSNDLRDKKPYAQPVQCLPYAGLKERDIRSMVTKLVTEMISHGMQIAGKLYIIYESWLFN